MAPPGFDPFHQNVTFHYEDNTPFNVSINSLNYFVQYSTTVSINYGSQIGASLLLLIILALMTRPDRRKSPVYLLNLGALLCNSARMICKCIYFTSPFSDVYAYFSGDYSRVPTSAYVNSILGLVLTLFTLICLEASLVLQVQVICSTTRPLYRHLVLAASLVFAFVAIGFRIAFVVVDAKYILAALDSYPTYWLQSATNIAVTASICFFSAVFILKLGFAIRQRRQLGFRKFGPMQVIFIMGCQTMFVPSIFSISQYFTEVSELGSNVLTLVSISLPLSSMWATAALENSHDTIGTGKLWVGSSASTSSTDKQYSGAASTTFTHGTLPGAQTQHNTMSAANVDRHSSLYPDLEAGDAIHVDRKFSVASCRQ